MPHTGLPEIWSLPRKPQPGSGFNVKRKNFVAAAAKEGQAVHDSGQVGQWLEHGSCQSRHRQQRRPVLAKYS